MAEDSTLRLEPLLHRDQHCIALRGRLNERAEKIVRTFPGRLFSKTHGCWYIPYSLAALNQIVTQLNKCQSVDAAAFDQGAAASKAEPALTILPDGYHDCLVRVRYSVPTIKTYESQMRKFIEWMNPRTLEDLSDQLINEYQLYLAQTKGVSISTQNTAINAIKFYLEKVHHGERKVYYVERPMKEEKLPYVLTQEEMKRLIEATSNVKHKCMILILYSSGIRMSELLNLKWEDMDEKRLELDRKSVV